MPNKDIVVKDCVVRRIKCDFPQQTIDMNRNAKLLFIIGFVGIILTAILSLTIGILIASDLVLIGLGIGIGISFVIIATGLYLSWQWDAAVTQCIEASPSTGQIVTPLEDA